MFYLFFLEFVLYIVYDCQTKIHDAHFDQEKVTYQMEEIFSKRPLADARKKNEKKEEKREEIIKEMT